MYSELLEIAKNRYLTKNELTTQDYNLSMEEFILKIYNSCDPSTYGKAFTTKINKDFPDEFFTVPDGEDNGDLCVTYPRKNNYLNRFSIITGIPGYYMCDLDFKNEVKKIFIEGKISYLSNKSKRYTIRNIRPYQNFDYFLLCLVDCDNDFKGEYIVVDKKIITGGKFNLAIMNGTKKSNVENGSVGMGYAFGKNSWQHKYLIENNKLGEESTYKGFIKFIENERIRLDKEFWDWENHLTKMKWLKKLIKTKKQFVKMYLESNHPIDIDQNVTVGEMIDELNKNGWKQSIDDKMVWESPIDGNSFSGNGFSYERLQIETKLKSLYIPFK